MLRETTQSEVDILYLKFVYSVMQVVYKISLFV
jgi:hypothetical protein